MNAIPYGRQNITRKDIDAVIKVLKSDYLTQGPKIEEFEIAFANYVESKYAVAVSNGTAALHLNAIALNVKPGDKVITTPITFAASANCVRYCGGEVVFADIDPETYLIDINHVENILEQDLHSEIKGIIPVNFAGRVVDMEAFRNLAEKYNCWIIEDACHSPGGFFVNSKNEKVKSGSGKYADLSIFSFHPVKHIAAGEGGMITTNNEELYQKLLELRTHGITKNNDKFQNSINIANGQSLNDKHIGHNEETYPNWYMEMQQLGYNYRLTDFQASLGNSQLKRADNGLIKRKKIASRYYEAFKDLPQITDKNFEALNTDCYSENGHAYHLYVVEAKNRLELYNHLRHNKIYSQIHYFPCHLMPYYKAIGNYKEGDFRNAENYYKSCLSLPMFPTLTKDEQEFVIKTVKEFYV